MAGAKLTNQTRLPTSPGSMDISITYFFGNNPFEDVHVPFLFGVANDQMVHPEEEEDDRAIHIYFSKEQGSSSTHTHYKEFGSLTADVVARLALLYSDEGDDDKAISVHRWQFKNLNRGDEITMEYLPFLSQSATTSVDPKIMIIDIDGIRDLGWVFIRRGERRCKPHRGIYRMQRVHKGEHVLDSMNKNVTLLSIHVQIGRIEMGFCNSEAAIDQFRK